MCKKREKNYLFDKKLHPGYFYTILKYLNFYFVIANF